MSCLSSLAILMTLGESLQVSIFQASLCWDLSVQRVGFVCFLFGLFDSSTCISSDAQRRNSRQQVQFLYISWFETSRFCVACPIEI